MSFYAVPQVHFDCSVIRSFGIVEEFNSHIEIVDIKLVSTGPKMVL